MKNIISNEISNEVKEIKNKIKDFSKEKLVSYVKSLEKKDALKTVTVIIDLFEYIEDENEESFGSNKYVQALRDEEIKDLSRTIQKMIYDNNNESNTPINDFIFNLIDSEN